MKNNFKKYLLPLVMVLVIIVVWKSAAFLKRSYNVLPGILEKHLPFKVNPYKYGGDTAAFILDNINDNKNYILPVNETFKNAYDSTDITSYKVHYPVKNSDLKYIWNLDIEFKNIEYDQNNPNKFGLIKGAVYIDLFNDSGSNKSFYDSEKINFPEDFKWDYYIEFDYLHKEGRLFSHENKKNYPVKIIFSNKNKIIRLSVPVVEKINNKMDKEQMGKHIIAVGLYSVIDEGNLISLNEKSDIYHSGAGINYKNETPYYDFVCFTLQKSDKGKLILTPVSILESSDRVELPGLDDLVGKLTKISLDEYNSFYGNVEDNELNNAIQLYNLKKFDEAVDIFIKYKDYSSIANTYLGVIQASITNKIKSTDGKIDSVNKAYQYFDESEKLAKNDNDFYLLFANRIGVSVSVPDEVFNKLILAESDINRFLKLGKLTKQEKAKYYLILINVLKNKNKIRELRFAIEDIKNAF